MEQIFVRADVLRPERLKALSRRSDARGWAQIAAHFGAISASGAALAATLGGGWAIPVFLAHGVLINFLYAGQHELSHATVFRTRGLNVLFGRLIGFILITPRDADQIQHFAHHRYTQLWRQDGELYRPYFTLARYLLRLSGIEYWSGNVTALLQYAAGRVEEPYIDGPSRRTVIVEARWHLAGYAAILAASLWAHSSAALVFWLAPMLLAKCVHQLQNTIEHVGMPKVADVVRNTRTIRTNAVMRWLCWNMQYHTAHHAFPSVPFFRLAELHAEIFTRRGVTPATMTYLGFQRAVIAALWRAGEADQPVDRPWVGDPARGV